MFIVSVMFYFRSKGNNDCSFVFGREPYGHHSCTVLVLIDHVVSEENMKM